MKKVSLLLLLTIVLSSSFAAQNEGKGTLSGKVYEVNNSSKEPVPFANVVVLETYAGTTTDFDGAFNLSLKPGKYHVVFSFIGYKPDTQIVVVEAGNQKSLSVTLEKDAIDIEAFTVEAKKDMQSENMLLLERKEISGIQQQIGAQELTKTGSSDVAAGLTKVAGLSVVGSKHVYVRGMGDRYNSAYLNGMPIASPDPDKKVIPLDIFPTSVVSNIAVNKSYSPKLYGDFSGAAIDIKTKDYPEEPTFQVQLSSGFNTSSFLSSFKTYSGGKYDYLGFDDGTRDIPSQVAAEENYNSSYNKEQDGGTGFANNLNPITTRAPLNSGVQILGGNFINTFNKEDLNTGIGFLALVSHSNSNSIQEGAYRIINLQSRRQVDYDFIRYNVSTSSSALANLLIKPHKNHKISYNFLYSNVSSDDFRETDGTHFDYQKNIFSRRYTFVQNNLMANQIAGEHKFLKNRIKLSWGLSSNIAKSKEPDRRQLVYLYDENGYVFNAVDRLENHRFFSSLHETEITKDVHVKGVIIQNEESAGWAVTVGAQQKNKQREFDFSQFTYDLSLIDNKYPTVNVENPDEQLSNENHASGLFKVQEVSNPASKNNALLMINALYIDNEFNPYKWLNINAGARLEQGYQEIKFRDQQQPIFIVKEKLESVDILPVLTSKITLKEDNFLKFSGSKTISRPGFKEVAPFEYVEFFAGLKSRGNPALVNGTNYNADLSYEFFPRIGELIAVTAFGKYLQNPIERTMLATASGQLQSFQNANEAYVAGVELEVRKKLDSLFKNTPILRDLSIGMNASYIYSQVNLSGDSTTVTNVVTNTERALQGASPYLINFDLNYEKFVGKTTKMNMSLAYNVYGARIYSVGIFGLGDVYELPVNTLNAVLSLEFNNTWTVSLKARHILTPTTHLQQETPQGFDAINSYKRGTDVGISVAYNIPFNKKADIK